MSSRERSCAVVSVRAHLTASGLSRSFARKSGKNAEKNATKVSSRELS